jgi:hypothetical protein
MKRYFLGFVTELRRGSSGFLFEKTCAGSRRGDLQVVHAQGSKHGF